MGRDVPVHYLRPNHADYTPASVIFLDTETRVISGPDPEVLGLRLWVATYVDRRTRKKTTPRQHSGWGRTAPALVKWIEDACRNRDSVWLYAHNLAFDLCTTRLPLLLLQSGWTISDAAVGGKSPWLRLNRGRLTLTVVDSYSWLPVPLQEVAVQLRMSKPELPNPEDSEALWRARCGHDVDILATAMLDLMSWWDERKLGRWTISGAASGWNAYRHTPTNCQIVVDPEPAKVAKDRTYVHGGRRAVWALGQHNAGPFYELDFQAAYPTIASTEPHPTGRAYTFESMPLNDPIWDTDRWDLAARCLIRTDTPRWPIRAAESTWYPVGELWADLAGPDIAEARRLGALVQVGPGEAHKVDTHMAAWAQWCLGVQHGTDPYAPPVARIAAKAWGRSVIGKWSARGFERTPLGPSPSPGWGYEPGWDHDAGVQGGMVDLGGTRFWVAETGTPDNAYPAIHAWVEAHVRVRLGRVIDALGEGCLLQANTDGLIVSGRTVGTKAARGHLIAPEGLPPAGRLEWVLNCLHPVTAPLLLRVKHRASHVTVLGPQHVKIDAQRRFAGMPKDATEQDDGSYQARLWPGLQWQMQHGTTAGYTRPVRTIHADGPYPTGWITTDNRVVPVEVEVIDSSNQLVPWHRTRWAAAGVRRADVQHKALDALI